MTKIEFYRNNIDLQTTFTTIETDSLFYRKENKVILVDEDNHFEWDYNEKLFRFVGYDIMKTPNDEGE